MTSEEDIQIYLTKCAADTLRFLEGCSKNLTGVPERAMIGSIGQYVDVTRKILTGKCNEDDCVSPMDVIEAQIIAMRSCLLDLEKVRELMDRKEKLN